MLAGDPSILTMIEAVANQATFRNHRRAVDHLWICGAVFLSGRRAVRLRPPQSVFAICYLLFVISFEP
jgi:hypothetical protein